jgi:hypothetical protein
MLFIRIVWSLITSYVLYLSVILMYCFTAILAWIHTVVHAKTKRKIKFLKSSYSRWPRSRPELPASDLKYQDQSLDQHLIQYSVKNEDTENKTLNYTGVVVYVRKTLTFIVSREPRKRRPNALQVPLPRRLSWPCVSDLQSIYKAESWQRAVTLDDSTPQCRLCENRCGVSTSLLRSRHHRQVKLAVKT